jgi:hypothetical protein
MKGLLLAGIAAVGVTVAPASVTYTFAGSNYNFTRPYTSCTAGSCANFTTSMSVAGSVTLSSALAPNLALQSIAPQVIAYSFSDGINTFSNTDPNARLFEFAVATDANGQISNSSVILEVWQSGSSPHQSGDRFGLLEIEGSISAGADNVACSAVGTSVFGAADSCTGLALDPATSIASTTTAGTWAVPLPVPAIGTEATIFLAILLMLSAWLQMRRQERVRRAACPPTNANAAPPWRMAPRFRFFP